MKYLLLLLLLLLWLICHHIYHGHNKHQCSHGSYDCPGGE